MPDKITTVMRLEEYVEAGETLYHGTAFENLASILEHGLKPGAGVSPHRTKTRKAVFLTDDMQGALAYSGAGSEEAPIVILEVNPSGFKLEPDYDDAADVISVDLMELHEHLRDPREREDKWGRGALIKRGLLEGEELDVGDEIPEDLVADVENVLEYLNEAGERAAPVSLEVAHAGDKPYLYARPFVWMRIDESAMHELPEMYDAPGIAFQDGEPGLLIQQYRCKCNIPFSSIRAVYLDDRALKELDIESSGNTRQIKDFETIVMPEDFEEDGDWQERADDIDFRSVTLHKYTPDALLARLAA